MRLHFPNERLRVSCHLSNGQVSCLEALSLTAAELGFLKGKLKCIELDDGIMCGSLRVARYVLDECADQVPAIATRKEKIWQEFISEIEDYKKSIPACQGNGEFGAQNCGQLAPVVMDLLLQHLRSYL